MATENSNKENQEKEMTPEEKQMQSIKAIYDENVQLKNAFTNLQNQANNLYENYRQITSLQMRLDYLFKVIENSAKFEFTFIDSCTNEIQELMTLLKPQKADNSTKEENSDDSESEQQ